ncbi:MAG: hypothetical protein HYX69_20235 [Planctomycetia bacterium]|nr:hypothetical protein [Planctomycetia bacterium]
MNNRFDPEKYYDHKIVDGTGAVVGHIRVKPSGVLWAPKNGKVWHGLPIEKFGELMEREGKTQKK